MCRILEEFFSLLSDIQKRLLCCRTLEGQGFFVEPDDPLHLLNPLNNRDLYVNTYHSTFSPSDLNGSRHSPRYLSLALESTVGWNVNIGLWNVHWLLTRKVFSGALYPYSSYKTNAKKSEISTKIDVYSYRSSHQRASCSAGVLSRGCWAVTCNTQLSVYYKHLGHHQISGILCSSPIVALDLFCCHCGRSSYHWGIWFLQLCPVMERSLYKRQTFVGVEQWLAKSETWGESHHLISDCWHWFGIKVQHFAWVYDVSLYLWVGGRTLSVVYLNRKIIVLDSADRGKHKE